MNYELVEVKNKIDAEAYHRIRKEELFDSRPGRHTYNPNHPDGDDPRNIPLLLKYDGSPVGTLRLDLKEEGVAIFRLVAITKDVQGGGHGRVLAQKVEQLARKKGIQRLHVNAVNTAIGYYEKLGFKAEEWDPTDSGMAEDNTQMVKDLD